jgi:hypothetical protein
MFVQVITGRTSQPQALVDRFDRWRTELAPGATGWLGSTGGVTDDGRFIAVARFESEQAAMANSGRPEQGAWWAETERLLDGEAVFRNSTDVEVDLNGDPDEAGFVQVMQGRGSDPERAKQIMAQDADAWAQLRPDVIGSLTIGHDQGGYTMVMYFTSEAAAREGERKEMPPKLAAQMEELNSLNIGQPEFFDLKQPVMSSAD